jgi:long-chain fatty acid transport protein
MTTFRPLRLALAVLVTVLGLTTGAAAQSNDEVFPNLQWNFSTPGARANGMGRTFIGKADDATAAVTNPAGLFSLTRPQVYVEFKNSKLTFERHSARNSMLT